MSESGDAKSFRGWIRFSLIAPAVLAGIILPIDFLSQVDGYLMYLRPWELLPVFGLAWMLYTAIGLAISAVLLAATAGLVAIIPRHRRELSASVGTWFSLTVLSLTLFRNAKLWLISAVGISGVSGWLVENQGWLMAAIAIGCAGWTLRRVGRQKDYSAVAFGGWTLGAIVAVVGLFISWLHPSTHPAESAVAGGSPDASHPNIILLTADALAAGRLSIYDSNRETTPNLRAMAEHATVFDRYYANGNFTTASVNSMIDGVRPWTHRANQFLATIDPSFADHGLVARLHRAGYQTLAVSTNPDAAPFHNGNSRWFDCEVDGKLHDMLSNLQAGCVRWAPHIMAVSNLSVVVLSTRFADRLLVATGIWSPTDQFDARLPFAAAQDLLTHRDSRRPFFLWVHLLSPHAPYASPFVGKFDPQKYHRTRFSSTPRYGFNAIHDPDFPLKYAGRYDESVLYTDAEIGAFIQWLKDQSLYSDSLFVVSTDHGESFSKFYGGHGGPMLHEDLIHLPLMIKEPNQKTAQRVSDLAEQVDLMPTLLDLADVKVDDVLEGHSLVAALHREAQQADRAVFAMNFEQSNRFGPFNRGVVAMIQSQWKYVAYYGPLHYPSMPGLKNALYDLQTDPHETVDLTDRFPQIAAKMAATIDGELRSHRENGP